jgi:2-oxoisovalerate dehydrogenase E2 component (dihydrolipoyl transacylase)
MPDLGEGTVSAEVVEWKVKVGDTVQEDQVIAEVMTDKAAVEIPSPVTGRVVAITGQPGDMVAVGSELIAFDTSGQAPAEPAEAEAAKPAAAPASQRPAAGKPAAPAQTPATPEPAAATRVMASPATRRKAHVAGVDLSTVSGSGPGGRISAQDLESVIAGKGSATARPAAIAARRGVEEIKVIGVRRVIAERMSAAKRNIPHFAYVEEVDVTELESLRQYLNSRQPKGTPSLTYLPFLVAALVRVLERFPQCNAVHDAERNVILRHSAVHVGVATQTPDGLKVPVVKHAEARSLHDLAAEIRRVSEAARTNKATREELTGSTITVTSLGRLGGIASTPVINAPEVAIVGVNKAVERPVVVGGGIAVRRIMNLSSSFDHRFVDGFDAAAMIQALKEKLEHPATIFIQD